MWIRCQSGITEIMTLKDDSTKGEPFRIPTGEWIHVAETNDKVFIDGKDIQDAKA